MKTLETNDWMVLNRIIYMIHTTEDFNEMRRELLEQLKMVMDFESADFYLGAKDGSLNLVDLVAFNTESNVSSVYDKLDYSRGLMYSGKSMVYRETDIISDEKRVTTEYYRKVYRPNKWHYSLQMILGRDKEFLGVITFYRLLGKENFRYDDVFILEILLDHLEHRLFKQKTQSEVSQSKLTITQAAEKFDLTKREQSILKSMMDGMDNVEMCDELSISVNTLKKHILNIYRKINVKNRVQLFKMIKEKE